MVIHTTNQEPEKKRSKTRTIFEQTNIQVPSLNNSGGPSFPHFDRNSGKGALSKTHSTEAFKICDSQTTQPNQETIDQETIDQETILNLNLHLNELMKFH
jgi:hypothetical protein